MLSAHHNPENLRQEYLNKGRISIKSAFQPAIADQLLQTLQTEVPWQLGYMNGKTPYMIPAEQIAQATPSQLAITYENINRQATAGFQFCYSHYSVTGENLTYCPLSSFLNQFKDYLHSEEFFDFAKTVTGNNEINALEILAAKYSKGNFLRTHDDIQKKERRIAFVLNLTKGWSVDLGGLLHFLDSKGDVVETYMPAFNSLTLFSVPAPHCVSFIPPYVEISRYSVAGWLTV